MPRRFIVTTSSSTLASSPIEISSTKKYVTEKIQYIQKNDFSEKQYTYRRYDYYSPTSEYCPEWKNNNVVNVDTCSTDSTSTIKKNNHRHTTPLNTRKGRLKHT